MFGKQKSKTVVSASSGSVKKQAPPRPPPPSKTSMISRSASMGADPWKEGKGKNPAVQRVQTVTCSYNITNRSDLIDLSSPSSSPPKVIPPFFTGVYPGVTSNEVSDYKYHVGASIFYIKSELKSTTGGVNKPAVNPFSPPRPSPQAILTKTTVTTTKTSKLTSVLRQPTIIKGNAPPPPPPPSDNINNNNNGYANSSQSQPKVLLEWDEPPKKLASQPTVIRPIPPPKKPGLSSIRSLSREQVSSTMASSTPFSYIPPPIAAVSMLPRYDDPPEAYDDEFEDSYDSSNAPEPQEPPPPPPPDMDMLPVSPESIDQYEGACQSNWNTYSSDTGDQSYGIAIYDYVSSEPGDLQFSSGDVIYLTRLVDDSWLYGTCGSAEGMFPANFVNIVVPLADDINGGSNRHSIGLQSPSSNEVDPSTMSYPTHYVQVLHDFYATEPTDLTIYEGDIITVIGKLNDDWLYGEAHGHKGQFPASFLEYVPANLPVVDPTAQ